MAKLHSRKKGKSGSNPPKKEGKPEWSSYTKEEVEEIIRKLAREGVPPTKIGLVLRDQYSIPLVSRVLGMSMGEFLEKEKLTAKFPEDILSLIKKAVGMRNHMKQNKMDTHNRVKLTHVESKIHRLSKYYRKSGCIPAGWKYDPETAALLVK
ncbi:30S ribosomal protein S15 [Candidatus Micrarchaeota archaeon]|nr:30S ribosomal protein S15 [Candidatus Micrarchaeota archaeon]